MAICVYGVVDQYGWSYIFFENGYCGFYEVVFGLFVYLFVSRDNIYDCFVSVFWYIYSGKFQCLDFVGRQQAGLFVCLYWVIFYLIFQNQFLKCVRASIGNNCFQVDGIFIIVFWGVDLQYLCIMIKGVWEFWDMFFIDEVLISGR